MTILGGIQLMQWNYYGIRSKLPYLQATEHLYDVICIQESLLRPHNSFWIRGFNTIRKDIISSNERGTCILLRDNLTYSVLDLSPFTHSSLELQGITLIQDNEPLAVINIYRHPNQLTSFFILDHLMSFTFDRYKNIIFIGDMNAHHSWWKFDYENNAGKILSRLIDTYNLVVLNDRLPTILLPPNARYSVIDLVLISSGFAP